MIEIKYYKIDRHDIFSKPGIVFKKCDFEYFYYYAIFITFIWSGLLVIATPFFRKRGKK